MKIQVTNVSDVKTQNGRTSSKVHAGDDFYYVNEDASQYLGKTLEITVEEKTSKKGNKYKIATINKVVNGASGGGNGFITWAAYREMASAAHALARQLEPDDISEEIVRENTPEGVASHKARAITVDRSAARAAILNTVMIAFSNGKISAPEPSDDDVPW